MLVSYETTNLNAEVRDGGAQKVMLHAQYRAGQNINLSVDVLDAEYVAAHHGEVTQAVAEFVEEACARAAAADVPVGGVVAAS